MSVITWNALYQTWKEQLNTPSTIHDLGQLTCRTIQKCCNEEDPTVSKIQDLILNPARNLLGIYNLQNNLFKLWELPSLLQGLQTVKNTCDALPIFSAINLIGSTSLGYIPYIKTPINFIQSSYSLKASIEAVLPSAQIKQTDKLNKKNIVIRNLLDELIRVDNTLQNKEGSSLSQSKLYEACQNLQQLIPQIDKSRDSSPNEALGILNRLIINSDDINKNLNSSEISKLKEILRQSIEEGYSSKALNKIGDEFKTHLNNVDDISSTKSLLELLKCAISWLLGASGILNFFFLGVGIPGTVLFSLEICSFVVRLTISFYKNYLNNM